MSITAGVTVVGKVNLPRGFFPVAARAPMWLMNGSEIGVIGMIDGGVQVLGYSGKGWRDERILAADSGPSAAEQGRIVDCAASPDGMTMAVAVAIPSKARLDIVIRDLIANGPGHPVTSFDGFYDFVSMKWINATTIAIVLHPNPNAPAPKAAPDSGQPPPTPAEGLQLLVITGPGSVAPLKFPYRLTTLDWSPDGAFAVSEGDANTPPVIIDRAHMTCARLNARAPVRVLGWDPLDPDMFLYRTETPDGKSAGVFKHSIKDGTDKLVAVGSGAAAYATGGVILAVGNQKLTFRMIADHPFLPIIAELAIFDPQAPQINIKELGFQTTPPMLAASTMGYSAASGTAVIQTFQPEGGIAMRKLITYTVHADSAYQVAYGPAHGVVETSWSPIIKFLAIVDGDAQSAALTIISPP